VFVNHDDATFAVRTVAPLSPEGVAPSARGSARVAGRAGEAYIAENASYNEGVSWSPEYGIAARRRLPFEIRRACQRDVPERERLTGRSGY